MTDLEAVERRISRRSYLETPLEPFTSGALLTLVGEYNRRAGLRVELVREGAEAFRGFRRSYGMFSGVNSYFAMAGQACGPLPAGEGGLLGGEARPGGHQARARHLLGGRHL